MAVKKEYESALQAMKDARTGQEMMASWKKLKPKKEARQGENLEPERVIIPLELYRDRKPEMIAIAHRQYTDIMERGIFEPKMVFLMMLACYMMQGHWEGVRPQMCNAKAAGATDEEIMEVAAIMNYARSKATAVDTSIALARGFESADFKNTQRLVKE